MSRLGSRTLAAIVLMSLPPLACGGRQTTSAPAGMGGMSTATAGTAGMPLSEDDQDIVEECPEITQVIANSPQPACSLASLTATFHYINVLLVVDRSASLNLPSVPADGKSNWVRMTEVMHTLLRSEDSLTRFGLILFPSAVAKAALWTEDSRRCSDAPPASLSVAVPIAPASTSVPAAMALLDTMQPSGGSPLAEALALAYDYYIQGEGASLNASKYVLLATDGAANCNPSLACPPEDCTTNLDAQTSPTMCDTAAGNCCDPSMLSAGFGPSLCLDDQRAVEQVSLLSASQIKTFVLGVASTDRYERVLNALAVAGGVPNATGPTAYYPANAEGGLSETLGAITSSYFRSCVVPLEKPPLDPSTLRLYIDCVPVPRQMTSGEANWRFELDAAGNARVVLEGSHCMRIITTGVKRVDSLLDCGS